MSVLYTESVNENFLSRQTTNSLKGLFALMVLISHLHARVEIFSSSVIGTAFSACGYLAVSGFFFVSGYGLSAGVQQKKDYIKQFHSKKILPYYAMCVGVILIYFLRDLLLTGSIDWPVFIQSFFFGKTIVDMGWYLQTQLVLYLLFYIAFRCFRNGLRSLAVLTVCYCVVCMLWGMSSFWYESVVCFALGAFCAANITKIVLFLKNRKRTLFCSGMLFVLLLATMLFGSKAILPKLLRTSIKMGSALCFTSLLVLVVSLIKIENPVTDFLGKYSFEVYALQGLFLYGYRPMIANDYLYILAVVGSVIAAAMLARPCFQLLNKRMVRMLVKE